MASVQNSNVVDFVRWGQRGDTAAADFPHADLAPFALARLVEGEIIPRLLLAHRSPEAAGAAAVAPGTPERFAIAALTTEAYGLLVDVDAYIAAGVTVETLFLDLLAPAARHLGTMWDNDECDFVDVTMALWRLQEIVHELAARVPGAATRFGGERRALFAGAPGEQHGFGTLMVDEFFRRAGWTTMCEPVSTEAVLLDAVADQWFEVVGLTLACDTRLAQLGPLIAALRARSRNPRVGIMVGGPAFGGDPARAAALAASCGADATAADGAQAVIVAETLLDILALRSEAPATRRG